MLLGISTQDYRMPQIEKILILISSISHSDPNQDLKEEFLGKSGFSVQKLTCTRMRKELMKFWVCIYWWRKHGQAMCLRLIGMTKPSHGLCVDIDSMCGECPQRTFFLSIITAWDWSCTRTSCQDQLNLPPALAVYNIPVSCFTVYSNPDSSIQMYIITLPPASAVYSNPTSSFSYK